jgi:hypothetical protein
MEKKKSVRKSKVRIYTEKGGLKGYSISDTMVNRRSILEKLLRKTPYSTIIKRLNVLAIYNKNRYPETSSKIKRDMNYLQKTFSVKKRSVKKPSAKKRSVKKRSVKKRSVKKGGRTMKGMCCCRRQCRGMCRWQGALPR